MVHTSFGCFEGSAMVKEQASLTVVNSSCCSCALQALGVHPRHGRQAKECSCR